MNNKIEIEFFINLCNFLFSYLNIIILILALIELILFIVSWLLLAKGKIAFKSLFISEITVADKEKGQGEYKETIQQELRVNRKIFNQKRDNYQTVTCVWYSVFSLIIQLFTLLGILGTVAGLFIALQEWDNSSTSTVMYDGIKFALSSTVLGILFALFFKLGDIFLSSVFINYIDDKIDRFDKSYAEADLPMKGNSIE